ncbi:MAG: PEGA domain-containing protein [Gammaproteobacteria bacterium]
MNDAAVSKPGAYSHVRVREPAGERTLGTTVSIGGEGSPEQAAASDANPAGSPRAEVIVPGVPDGIALTIERRDADWIAVPVPGATIRLDGRLLTRPRELHKDDVLSVGEAQIVVLDDSRTRLRLDVQHLVGNQTIAPVTTVAAVDVEAGDEDLEILAVPSALGSLPPAAVLTAERTRRAAAPPRKPLPRKWVITIAATVVVVGLVTLLFSMLQPVEIDVRPSDARISTPGTYVSFRSGDSVYAFAGTHVVRAERDGYYPGQVNVGVERGKDALARIRLTKLPGKLRVDTDGVAASVFIDGVEGGKAPGEVTVQPGARTVTLRAPRYLDHVESVDIEGGGARQDLKATLQPSWGTLEVNAVPEGASVSVDGTESGKAPASIEADSGVRRVTISAPNLKTWESSVVVTAGQTLAIGPITLGQPDLQLTLHSNPSGAEITIAGTYRGRAPLTIDLPASINHDIVATLPGHANWTKTVFAEPGKKLSLDAKLQPILAGVDVRGEPADAELFIDGKSLGKTPQSLQLSAIEHLIEVRKEGFVSFTGTVTPALGLERLVEYKLISADRGQALQESAPVIKTKSGYELRLIPGGTFMMGSERREQGRRPNEGLRPVTLKRPFYLGVTEITNAEFRKFRPEHVSGYVEKKSFDLDLQPVVNVSWNDAAEFCNWLSEREGLPPAYEQGGGKYSLKKPVTTGYRLPTEAEWEYAARYSAPGKVRRFPWGDSLPVAPQTGNLAGTETLGQLEGQLSDYHDDYPVVAPVGKFQPSPLGLHDLGGNVSEWVNDFYLTFVDPAAVTDPLGPDQAAQHIVRGANWKTGTVGELRFAWRDTAPEPSQTLGFRIARYAE